MCCTQVIATQRNAICYGEPSHCLEKITVEQSRIKRFCILHFVCEPPEKALFGTVEASAFPECAAACPAPSLSLLCTGSVAFSQSSHDIEVTEHVMQTCSIPTQCAHGQTGRGCAAIVIARNVLAKNSRLLYRHWFQSQRGVVHGAAQAGLALGFDIFCLACRQAKAYAIPQN